MTTHKKIKKIFLLGTLGLIFFFLPTNASRAADESCGCEVAAPVTEYTDVFKLQIPIPGFLTEFQPAEIQGERGSRFFYLPWIGQYVSAIYQYVLGIIGILATVMIVWAGIVWLTAAGSPEKIKLAKEYIGGAVIGLVLAFGSYLILYTLNPDLVKFGALKLQVIEPIADPRVIVGVDVPGVSNFEIPAEYYDDIVDISNKVGVKPCILASHFYMESRFSPTAASTCCYGFGATHINTIREWLGGCGGTGAGRCDEEHQAEACERRAQLGQLVGDPTTLPCPNDGSANTEEIANWFIQNTRANIAIPALYRKGCEEYAARLRPFEGGQGGGPGPYNAVTVIPIYGMGLGTVRAFAAGTGCLNRPAQEITLSNEDLQTKLLDGSLSVNDAIASACVPGIHFPIPKISGGAAISTDTQTFCGGGSGLCCKCDTRDTPEGIAQCLTDSECGWATFTDRGRWGICKQSGADDGKPCVAGGGDTYARTWLGALSTCLQKYPELR